MSAMMSWPTFSSRVNPASNSATRRSTSGRMSTPGAAAGQRCGCAVPPSSAAAIAQQRPQTLDANHGHLAQLTSHGMAEL
jgi:hypothetical protein